MLKYVAITLVSITAALIVLSLMRHDPAAARSTNTDLPDCPVCEVHNS